VLCSEKGAAVWQGDHFYVLLDVAPIVEGHALICSYEHYPSAADLPAELVGELDELCGRLQAFYAREYRTFTLFEHGRTGHCVRHSPAERACNHLHVHVLPLPSDLTERIGLGQRTTWRSWCDVGVLGADVDGYVAVQTPAAGRCFYPVLRTLPSHYLRTRAAELTGSPEVADWEAVVGNGSRPTLVERARERFAAWTAG
jgi:diadenosine tetraphosphate (Ap4A) HIT family hydrolase